MRAVVNGEMGMNRAALRLYINVMVMVGMV